MSLFSDKQDETTFLKLGLPEFYYDYISKKLGYVKPSIVQHLSFSPILAGRDILMKSETGSGKTLAFLLPILLKLSLRQPHITRDQGTKVIILTPTRELCNQIYTVAQRLLIPFHWIVPSMLSGGEKRTSEKARLRKGCTLLVATPGRLLDHILSTKSFVFSDLEFIVFDEADRTLDLGFEKTITDILVQISKKVVRKMKNPTEQTGSGLELSAHDDISPEVSRIDTTPLDRIQVLLVSATLKENLTEFAGKVLTDPVRINPAILSLSSSKKSSGKSDKRQSSSDEDPAPSEPVNPLALLKLPSTLTQLSLTCPSKLRLVALLTLLRGIILNRPIGPYFAQKESHSIIVFVSTCASAEFHMALFEQLKMPEFGRKGKHGRKPRSDTASDAPKASSSLSFFSSTPSSGAATGDEEDTEQYTYGRTGLEGQAHNPPFLPSTGFFRLHGDMSQLDRVSTINAFAAISNPTKKSKEKEEREGKKFQHAVMFCTDVASRGIDLRGVSEIIQYERPGSLEEYVHRAGRTSRAGEKGTSVLFVREEERDGMERTLEIAKIGKCQRMDSGRMMNDLATQVGEQDPVFVAAVIQHSCESLILSDGPLKNKSEGAFRSFVRGYTTVAKTLSHVFNRGSLHSGHVATSFGLKDSPREIGKSRPGISSQQDSESIRMLQKMKNKPVQKQKRPHSDQSEMEISHFTPSTEWKKEKRVMLGQIQEQKDEEEKMRMEKKSRRESKYGPRKPVEKRPLKPATQVSEFL
ncbi:putative DEAD-box ATP-dependent RNA helicase 17 [Blattamonas nauphoetae]|uniref:ATP-dependent RNA helicase n=1 Tax=Blattamonas nauphoetae TaxID=2049346 RepID=A0ABQ9YC65_9EUKA|nr:putative DEAD-box ATP-dependent RNA helicase 17 [Blattamonas nauphoetae]